ncbi:nucleoside deaminase [Neolewinella persica]|uniref:nucleoside deaminase n=1 Tax=Neolewinella persica TaxID=70998 RepID=UPI0003612F36|nr:nucleoside deaminase [Neolewinella persica]
MLKVYDDDYFMRQAIEQAKLAAAAGEIPVGAVVVANERIIARGHNQTELLSDVTAHAEIIALTAAANHLGDKYLHDCTLYVTLEPCPMCAGALAWSQVSRIVYGASDDKRGFMRFGRELLHPKTTLEFGIMHEACGELMTSFFRGKRNH